MPAELVWMMRATWSVCAAKGAPTIAPPKADIETADTDSADLRNRLLHKSPMMMPPSIRNPRSG